MSRAGCPTGRRSVTTARHGPTPSWPSASRGWQAGCASRASRRATGCCCRSKIAASSSSSCSGAGPRGCARCRRTRGCTREKSNSSHVSGSGIVERSGPDQPLSLGQGQHAGSLPPFDPGARSRAEGPAVLAKIPGSDAPPAQGSKIASVRTSIDSRGAASAGVSGNSKALCGVKRARSPRLSQPLISRTSSRSIFGA